MVKIKREEIDARFLLRKSDYCVLSREEVLEILNSNFPENHVIAAKFFKNQNMVLLIRGDFKIIRVPAYQFPILNNVYPDFSKITLEDLGLTLKFGEYIIDAQPMIIE